MGAEGRRRTAELTWDHSAKAVVDLYETVARADLHHTEAEEPSR
jgi:hypothetical protein